jgi:hypothetical protein
MSPVTIFEDRFDQMGKKEKKKKRDLRARDYRCSRSSVTEEIHLTGEDEGYAREPTKASDHEKIALEDEIA